MVTFVQSTSYCRNFIKNKPLKLNENRFSICRLDLNLIIQKNSARKMQVSYDALKTRGIKSLNTETWLLFALLIKISGYAPAASS